MIVIDVGSGKPKHKLRGTMLDISNNGDYLSVDRELNFGPCIVADACNLPFRDSCADAVIFQSVIEHIAEPHQAVNEIHRVLKSGGVCYVIAPFLFGDHDNAVFSDYYRFTKGGLRYLFRLFTEQKLEARGGALTVLLIFATMGRRIKSFEKFTKPFVDRVDKLIAGDAALLWYAEYLK